MRAVRVRASEDLIESVMGIDRQADAMGPAMRGQVFSPISISKVKLDRDCLHQEIPRGALIYLLC